MTLNVGHSYIPVGSILDVSRTIRGKYPAGYPTHNHYLNVHGYDTALAGKAHFIGPDQLHGFTERFMTDIYPPGFRFMPARGDSMKPENLHPPSDRGRLHSKARRDPPV